MQIRTVEWVAGLVGIAVPVVVVIWLAASTVTEMREMAARMETLEAQVAAITEAQVADRLVNDRVTELSGHVDWLRYHHHHEGGEGHPHVD